MNKLAKQLIEENLKTKNPTLDLGKCGLDGTEPELELLAACTHLKTLIFSSTWYEYEEEKPEKVWRESQNKGVKNKLIQLPSHLPKELEYLVLTGDYYDKWEIQDISPLKDLQNLQTLNLRNNQIQDISTLNDLQNLQTLGLSYNQIQDISTLNDLKQLQTLDLRSNQIQDISPLKDLKNLQTLDLSANQIQDISTFNDLKKLQTLDLRNNRITTNDMLNNYRDAIYFLRDYLESEFDINIIEDKDLKSIKVEAPEKLISNPKIAKYLLLQKNQGNALFKVCSGITWNKGFFEFSLQETIVSLPKNLKTLMLSRNDITDVSFLKDLKSLQRLKFDDNQIQDVSLAFLNNFPELNELQLYHNPIQNIPKEIFDKQGTNVLNEVKNYLEDEAKGSEANKVLKIILIGNGSVGKTQIAKRWTEGKDFVFDATHQSTHAIALLETEVAGVRLEIWDFAGQDIYHATHRLFMQTSAIFFLVWDFENEFASHHQWKGKDYKNEKLEYWLEYALHFGKGSPVLILQNKVDTEEDKEKTYLQEDWEKLRHNYPVLESLQISAKTGKGFKLLTHKLKKAFKENETLKKQIHQTLPTNWLNIREQIKILQAKGQKMLSLQDFEELCKKEEIESVPYVLIDYFHNVGLCYYRAGYFNNQIILNQDWAIQAIYKILDRESDYFEILADKKGLLEYEDLEEIWEDNTDEERELFMDFMLSAELCFETTENKEYDTPLKERTFIVPHLLPARKQKEVDFYKEDRELSLKETLYYRFLPTVFIQRFIVKANRFSEVKHLWQKGIFLETTEGDALVEANYDTKMIEIFSNAPHIIEKIAEELEAITQEGNIKAQASKGIYESKTEKYLAKYFGLEGLRQKTKIDMKETIEKALTALEEANYAGYFDAMDKLKEQMSLSQKNTYNTHKQRFIQNQYDVHFAQQLTVFSNANFE